MRQRTRPPRPSGPRGTGSIPPVWLPGRASRRSRPSSWPRTGHVRPMPPKRRRWSLGWPSLPRDCGRCSRPAVATSITTSPARKTAAGWCSSRSRRRSLSARSAARPFPRTATPASTRRQTVITGRCMTAGPACSMRLPARWPRTWGLSAESSPPPPGSISSAVLRSSCCTPTPSRACRRGSRRTGSSRCC